MSFGWSASDIVAAFQLLDKVAVALKDTGGASSDYQDASSFLKALSATLKNLKALQAAPLDPDLSQSLEQLCKQVQVPVSSFCRQINSIFERDLGAVSSRPKLLAVPRKLQWALSTSKKVKDLREKIGGSVAAIGIVLGQQVVQQGENGKASAYFFSSQSSLQMPFEIQARIAHTIDTAINTQINPQVLAIINEVKAISAAQDNSFKLIEGTIRDVGDSMAAEIQKQSQEITIDLQDKFNILSISNNAYTEGMTKIEDKSRKILEQVQNNTVESRTASIVVQDMISDLSAHQSQSNELILQRVFQTGQETAHAFSRHDAASQDQASSLHQKLDYMSWLMVTVKDRIGDLSIAQRSASLSTSNSEIQKAVDNIQRSMWILVLALHVLIRELIYLLAPYLVVIYRTSIQTLRLCGDHFLFEDAIGRRKWLPCLQFQHWDIFYNFLVDNFQGEAGLSRVLNGQFMILNGFNEVPIHKKAWRAGIQPRSRVAMAIMLEAAAVKKGRCADPSCSGQVEFRVNQVTQVCPICGKYLSLMQDSTENNQEFIVEAAFSFDFGRDIQIPVLKDGTSQDQRTKGVPSTTTKPIFSIKAVDKDISAFKRVIWQDSDQSESPEQVQFGATEESHPLAGKRPPRRPRVALTRQKPSLRIRKSDRLVPERPEYLHQANDGLRSRLIDETPKWALPDDQIQRVRLEQQRELSHLEQQRKTQIPDQFAEWDVPPRFFQDGQSNPTSGSPNHVLQDYQMQLMLLEQQNKKRLLLGRQELDSTTISQPSVEPQANPTNGRPSLMELLNNY